MVGDDTSSPIPRLGMGEKKRPSPRPGTCTGWAFFHVREGGSPYIEMMVLSARTPKSECERETEIELIAEPLSDETEA